MVELATLGLAVDSGPVAQGASTLDRFSGAAKRAEMAAEGYSSSMTGASAAAKAMATSSAGASAALTNQAVAAQKAATLATAAANQNARANGNMSNSLRMAAMQLSQVAQQGSATGNYLQALAIQLPDLALGFGTVGIALGVLGGVMLQTDMARNALQAGLTGLADILPTIAPYAAAAAAGIALLYAPAIIGGITLVSEAVLGLTARLAGLAIGFAMANPLGALVAALAVAATAATIFRDDLTRIFGVDIVGAAKTGINLVIGSFYAAFEDIKFVWNTLPQILGSAAIGAANAVVGAIETMINRATGLMNDLIGSVNGILAKLPGGVQLGTIGQVSFGQIDNPYAADLAQGIAGRNRAVSDALGRDYLGEFGTTISNAASGAADRLRALAAGFGEVEDAAKKSGGRLAKDDPWKGLRKAADDTLSKIREAGQSLGQSFGGILRGLLDKTTSWKDALLGALNSVLVYMNKMNVAQGGAGIFGGGFVQSLIGGFLGLSFAKGGVFAGGALTPFANGGVVSGPTVFPMANGMGLMGEAGPEAVMPLRRLPSGRLGVEASGGGRGGVNISIGGTSVTINGNADAATIDELQAFLEERDRKQARDLRRIVDDRQKEQSLRGVRA